MEYATHPEQAPLRIRNWEGVPEPKSDYLLLTDNQSLRVTPKARGFIRGDGLHIPQWGAIFESVPAEDLKRSSGFCHLGVIDATGRVTAEALIELVDEAEQPNTKAP